MRPGSRPDSAGAEQSPVALAAAEWSGWRAVRWTSLTQHLLKRGRALVVADRPLRLARYGLATVAITAVALMRAALFADFAPWFQFTPAVVLVTLFLGGGAGLWATLLATLAAGYVLSNGSAGMLTPLQWLASALFAVTTVGLVGVVVAMREALRTADAAQGELNRAALAGAARETFMASVLSSSTDCIKVLDLTGRLTFMSEGGQRVMEVSDFNQIAGCPWPDFWSGDGQTQATAAVAAANRGEASSFVDRTPTMKGTPKWWHVAVSPILDARGRPDRILSVSRDITALREAEQDLQLMNGELAHRLKNVLAVVQSVAHQTLRNATDLRTASEDLSARLVALGAATDVLTGASWRAADLREIATRALAPHGRLGSRIVLDGPDITLAPQVAVALALALHELATNAAKYGALANDGGTIALAWGVEGIGEAARFRLRWQERGGPPVVPPTRRGFGTSLIERSLRSYFGGTLVMDYQPEGVLFSLDTGPDAAVWSQGKV